MLIRNFQILVLGFFVLCLPASLFALEELQVDLDRVVQHNFLGLNAVYHGFTYMPESIEMGMTEELRQIEFDRVEQSGITIARTFYRPDWAMAAGNWTKPDWESERMQALYKWLAAMQERDIDVVLNMGWWFARDVIWTHDQHLASYPSDLRHYISWVSESLHQIIEKRGFDNVKYICMFTEPGNRYGDIPSGKKNWEYYRETLLETDRQLRQDNRRHLVQIIAPNTTQAPRWIALSVEELDHVIDIYSSHNYNFQTYDAWFEMAEKIRELTQKTGKPYWIDEYGVQDFDLRKSPDYGIVLALANIAFINAGAQTSLLWILNDQYYPQPIKYLTNGDSFVDGLHQWGLFPWLAKTTATRPAWHAFSLLSTALKGRASKVLYVDQGRVVKATAIRKSTGDIVLLVVNPSTKSQQITLRFSHPFAQQLHRYLYGADAQDDNDQSSILDIDSTQLTDVLPRSSFAVYTTTGLEGWDRATEETTSIGEENIALGKEISATSEDADWPATNLLDGERLSIWKSDPKKTNAVTTLQIDLEKNQCVGGIDILNLQLAQYKEKNEKWPVSVLFSMSRDALQWQDEEVVWSSEKGEEKEDFLRLRFPCRVGRYLQLTFQPPTVQDYELVIGDIAVYRQKDQLNSY